MLINSAAYEDGKRIAEPGLDELEAYATRPVGFVWVALRDASADELDRMRRAFDLHELAVEDARNGHQRPKLDEYGENLFVVMQLIERRGDELVVGQVAVFVGESYVVSARSHNGQHFLGVRERCEREPHLLKQGPSFVLYALMDAVVDRYFPVVEQLEAELESIEERIFAKGAARINIERLYALKRKVGVLKHAVAPLLEVLSKLHGGRTPRVCSNTEEYFRDVADHLERINASIDTIRDTIGTAIAVNLSMVTIEESEVTKRLAAWAGIFAVATAFAGIWGMNFEVMPELKLRWGYPAALGLIAGACAFVWWRFKRSGWL
ncbi:MAG: magnesium and cobalt transport protein CorA [Rhizobiales bacterium]|nr:magnesium and cobalt transport protein CorA [Rhizobacter sp.]